MKSSLAKGKIEKKTDSETGTARGSSVSIVDNRLRSKSRVSTISLYNIRQSLAWRASKGGFKMPKYQNNFRLEPYLPFNCEFSDRILSQVMMKNLKHERYNSETCSDLCRNIAAEVRDKLYKSVYDRVKYVVWMTIIENTGQSCVIDNGRLWDDKRDTYSVFVYENPTMYAAGFVAVIYYE